MIAKLAPKRLSVLITGETGAGKEALVRALHSQSGRTGDLKTVNCAAIPRALGEAMLFGHERGAFTGADQRSRGLFEEAHRGTLFLDEIGELSLDTQAILLRVLQAKRVARLGSSIELDVDVRIAAATHQDLERRVREGLFREDLFYRINTVTLHVPSLRERREEIEPLAMHFMVQAAAEQESCVRNVGPEAMERLREYHWPGNVRELRGAIERAVAFCDQTVIGVEDLPPMLSQHPANKSTAWPQPTGQGGAAVIDEPARGSFRERVRAFEVSLIETAMRRAGGNVTKCAELLRIPVRTLTHKLRAYGLRDRSE